MTTTVLRVREATIPLALATALAAQGAPLFRATAIDGRVATGVVTATADAVTVTPDGTPSGTAGAQTFELADLMTLVREGASTVAATTPRAIVWLRSGGVLPARSVDGIAAAAGGPARVRIETLAGGQLELPQTAIAALRCRDVEPATFAADRGVPDQNRDFLYVVKDGKPQRFSVTVASIHDGRLFFDLGGTAYDFPLVGNDSVAAVVFGRNTGFAADAQPKPRVTVTLGTGERCSGKLEGIDGTLSLLLDEGCRLAVGVAELRSLEVDTDRMTWLSTLTPRVEQTPAFDRVWPWTADGSPAGPGIRLGGRSYVRGFVLVPRTRLRFDLGGRYDLFETTIGIDERGGPQAHALFRVFADGKLLFESTPLQLSSPPQQLRLELARCRELAIEADFGKNFDLGDLCAFADARVLQRRGQ